MIANVSCASDIETDEELDDIGDPDYLLPNQPVSDDETEEDESLVLEIETNPRQNCSKSTKPRKTTNNRLKWDKIDSREGSSSTASVFPHKNSEDIAEMSPMDYFKSFMSDALLDKICEQSNMYSIQKDINKPLGLQREELEQWLGIAMQMSLTKLSNTRSHWSLHSFNQNISSTMARQRWEDIKSNLHFVDNSTINSNDKLAKVRLLLDHLRR